MTGEYRKEPPQERAHLEADVQGLGYDLHSQSAQWSSFRLTIAPGDCFRPQNTVYA
jgi:hypothetical protein